MSDTKATLIKQNYIINVGQVIYRTQIMCTYTNINIVLLPLHIQPAYSAWTVSQQTESIVSIYNKTNALLFAQQLFLKENFSQQNHSKYLKLKYLKTITDSVPLADRCLPVPTCNNSRKYVILLVIYIFHIEQCYCVIIQIPRDDRKL